MIRKHFRLGFIFVRKIFVNVYVIIFHTRRGLAKDNGEKHFSQTPIRLYMPTQLSDNVDATETDVAPRNYDTLAYYVENAEPPRKKALLELESKKNPSTATAQSPPPVNSWEIITPQVQYVTVSSSAETHPDPQPEIPDNPQQPLKLQLRNVTDLRNDTIFHNMNPAEISSIPSCPHTTVTHTQPPLQTFKPNYSPSVTNLQQPYSPTMAPAEMTQAEWRSPASISFSYQTLPDESSWANEVNTEGTGPLINGATQVYMID